ncbi:MULTISPECIES: VirK/YbjX family protein [unclassified Serratia (in: enterobacteria)]|uniref:VirK/YbjX family protein n=1 Tax=unclassified Serratia (in: enterobacteria) TaxID=2647522 RepID=UPI003075F4E0
MSQLSDSFTSVKPANGWQLITALLIGDKIPSQAWRKTSFRLKFFSRSLLSWPITSGLLNTLASNPLLDEILSAQPNLPCKLHRPYLAANMKHIDGLFALRDHYNLIIQRMPLKMRLGHLGRQPFTLSSAQGKNGEQICLQLAAIDKLNKEGEATLLLRNAKGIMLAEVTFTLMNYRHQPTLFIGGLQGAHCTVPHAEIQSTTKACHGLFPKRLVLEGTLQLAQQLKLGQVIAVGNSTHIYQNWRYNRKKRALLHADYDQFWASIGGKPFDDGYFLLPKHVARKPMEEIASKKRAEYRRRYQLLDELQQGIAAHFPQPQA